MINPLVDLTQYTDTQLEDKIQELTKKYFMARNPDLQLQIFNMLDMYKIELQTRRQRVYEQQFIKQQEKGLDNLININ